MHQDRWHSQLSEAVSLRNKASNMDSSASVCIRSDFSAVTLSIDAATNLDDCKQRIDWAQKGWLIAPAFNCVFCL